MTTKARIFIQTRLLPRASGPALSRRDFSNHPSSQGIKTVRSYATKAMGFVQRYRVPRTAVKGAVTHVGRPISAACSRRTRMRRCPHGQGSCIRRLPDIKKQHQKFLPRLFEVMPKRPDHNRGTSPFHRNWNWEPGRKTR